MATKQSSFRASPLDCFVALAMTSKRPVSPRSSPPGLTRWSMLTCSESNNAVTLSEPTRRMDCRVKPGNDDVKVRSRKALLRPSFAHHHHAISKISFAPGKKGRRSAERRMPTIAAQMQTSVQERAPLIRCAAARLADKCTQSAHTSASGARPPSGASTAALVRNSDVSDSAPGHASWDVDSARSGQSPPSDLIRGWIPVFRQGSRTAQNAGGRYPPHPVPVQ